MLTARATTPTATIKSNLTNPPPRRRLAGGILRTNSRSVGHRILRAVISSGDRTAESPAPAPQIPAIDGNGPTIVSSSGVQVTASVLIRTKIREKLVDKFEGLQRSFTNVLGQGISLELISEEIDPRSFSSL